MIFAPKGPVVGDVIDPNDLANEFIEASRIAEGQTQYQWENDALFDAGVPQMDKLVKGAPVTIQTVKQSALIKGNNVGTPQPHRNGTTAGFAPDLTVASGDLELFQVPYNRGYHLITGTNDMRLKWISKYPEMIFIFFSYQYTRLLRGGFGLNAADDTAFIRLKLQIQLDGSGIYGAGLAGIGNTSGFRGTGYGNRNLRTTHKAISFVGAGAHTIEALAGQNPCTSILDATDTEEELKHFGTPPNEGVCIAHRTLTVLRFPKGKEIGG